MLRYRGVQYFLNKLRNGDQNSKNVIFKEMTNSIQVFNTQDLQLVLEFLTTVNDIVMELKLISFLAMCLTSNDNHYEVIVTYNPLYEKIEAILSRGLPLRTTTVLTFITALVYDNDVECIYSKRKTLVLYVRNSIRVSGCLGAMTTLFTDSMMFPDTWKALCQSIAEVCRDCDLNKAQCSHLISLCVQKCLQGFKDVIAVLQSLLQDHPRNVQLFLSCNGIRIFTRETLQNISCLQLLLTLINNPQVASLIRNTDIKISRHITEILHWNGPHSQKGQWCTAIMYYLDSRDKQPVSQSEKIQNTEENGENTGAKEANKTANTKIHASTKEIHDNFNETSHKNDDTTKLFMNVVQEILYWKSKEEPNTKCTVSIPRAAFVDSEMVRDTWVYSPSEYSSKPKPSDQNKQEYEQKELSFSFLEEAVETNKLPTRKNRNQHQFQQENHSQRRPSNFGSTERPTETVDRAVKYLSEKSVQTNFESTSAALWQLNLGGDEKSTMNSKHFMPQVMSTPKRGRCHDHKIKDHSIPYSRKKSAKKSASSYVPTRHVYKERRRTAYKTVKKSSPVKLASRSMSARFFNAINESCTTLVKTVKNVFKLQKKDDAVNKTKKVLSSYSFMDYMRKRDAILGRDYIGDSKHNLEGFDSLSMGVNEGNVCKACNTCNDTAVLKEKLDDNEYLRKTVKKLKLGINLYGCDFNKISKTFWPQDTFMTPAVLYNLYRKLILK